jgi:hypothetical protein
MSARPSRRDVGSRIPQLCSYLVGQKNLIDYSGRVLTCCAPEQTIVSPEEAKRRYSRLNTVALDVLAMV